MPSAGSLSSCMWRGPTRIEELSYLRPERAQPSGQRPSWRSIRRRRCRTELKISKNRRPSASQSLRRLDIERARCGPFILWSWLTSPQPSTSVCGARRRGWKSGKSERQTHSWHFAVLERRVGRQTASRKRHDGGPKRYGAPRHVPVRHLLVKKRRLGRSTLVANPCVKLQP